MPTLFRFTFALAVILFTCPAARSQNNYIWNGAITGDQNWLNVANWTGTPAGFHPGVTNSIFPTGNSPGDTASINYNSMGFTLGFDMSDAFADGLISLGALNVVGVNTNDVLRLANTANSVVVDNGYLQLNGATVGGTANTLINLTSTELLIEEHYGQNNSTLTVRLGITNGIITVGNNSNLRILTNIVESNSGSSLTFQGTGRVELGANNSFSGGLTNLGDVRFLLTHEKGFGTGTVNLGNHAGTGSINNKRPALGFKMEDSTSMYIANAIVLGTDSTNEYFLAIMNSSGHNASNTRVTLAGQISGGSASEIYQFTTEADKNTTATFLLTHTGSTFQGTVGIQRGTLAITSDGSLGNSGNGIRFAGGSTATDAVYASTSLGYNSALRFDANNIVLSAGRTLTLFGMGIAPVNTNGFNSSINGTITDTSATNRIFVKQGAGTLTIRGTNILRTVEVNAGTLNLDYSVNNTNKLSTNATVTLRGGTLQMNANPLGSSQTIASVSFRPGGPSGISAVSNGGVGASFTLGSINRFAGGTINFSPPTVGALTTSTANASTSILGGWATVAGANWAVTGTGGGPYAVSSLSSYTADTWSAGINAHLTASNSSAFTGSVNSVFYGTAAPVTTTLTGNSIVSSGGILATAAVGTNAVLISGGNLTTGNNLDLIVHQNNTAAAMTIASKIIDPGTPVGLTKTGPGELILTNSNNTFSGNIFINQGTLSVSEVGDQQNLGKNPTTEGGALLYLSGTLRYTGSTTGTLSANRRIVLGGDGAAMVAAIDVVNDVKLIVAGGFIGDKSQPLVKRGVGTLELSRGSSTFYAGAIVSNGTLISSSNYGIGAGDQPGTVVLGDADTGHNDVAFFIGQNSRIENAIFVSNLAGGSVTIGSASTGVSPRFTGEITLQRSVVLSTTAFTTYYQGRITGTGDIIFRTIGVNSEAVFVPGTFIDNAINDFVGDVIIEANSTVTLSSGGVLHDRIIPNSSNVRLQAGSRLNLVTSSFGTLTADFEAVNALVSETAGAGTITFVDPFTLLVGAGNGSGTFSGAISSVGTIVKSGTGTQTFSGANTFSDGTAIRGGTLRVSNSTGSGTGTGYVIVENGGSLSGTGFIRPTGGNAVSLQSGGMLAPGGDVFTGALTIEGSTLSLSAGSVMKFNIGGMTTGDGGTANRHDLLVYNGTGTVALGGSSLEVHFTEGYVPTLNDRLLIIDNRTGNAISGTFDSTILGDSSINGLFVNVSYTANAGTLNLVGGNDVVVFFTPAPEPGGILGICLGALLLAQMLRRRVGHPARET